MSAAPVHSPVEPLGYREFIAAKMDISYRSGFTVDPSEIHPLLKPHQRDVVIWALAGGRRAIFANFGLGKTMMQLESLRQIGKREGGRQLIVAPLGVRQEFRADAAKLGLDIRFVRRDAEVDGEGLYLTNYESVRDGRLSVAQFNAASLDEADALRSYGSDTFQEFMTLFPSVRYRFTATATPNPNRYKELIHYAGFLGIMDTGQALTRFFQRDSTKAGNLTLYEHKVREFWLWMHTWAVFLQKPSDLGYSDEGYILPRLHVHYHMVQSGADPGVDRKTGQLKLVGDASLSLAEASKEKRESLPARIEKMRSILDENPGEHCLLWHDLESERMAIKKAVPEVVDIYGSMDLEEREERVVRFSKGEIRLFASKPVLSGAGCNFQRHCSMSIFLGIGFKFRDFIQSVHRIHRFLQERECHIHIIYADTEVRILDVLKEKWRQHNETMDRMAAIIREFGLSGADMRQELSRSMGTKRVEVAGKKFLAANNDCVEECVSMDENSVDMVLTSIPFSNHYEYTPNYNDFGHTDDNGHFWAQMDYLTPELLRILRPGRIYACHVKDRILFGNVTGKGYPTVSPFHCEAVDHALKHEFEYMGMIIVVTDVVRENNQTYRLTWSEQCKDGTKMGVGSPEYILLLRKPQTDRSRGNADIPVTKTKDEYPLARWQLDAHAHWNTPGDRLLTPEELATLPAADIPKAFEEWSLAAPYDFDTHVRIGDMLRERKALPTTYMAIAPASRHPDVWTDVNRMLTLNGDQKRRNLVMHVCPLQFDIVDRLITRYTNADEIVFDPFAGLMTVPYRALKLGRRGRGVELSPEYFTDGIKYLKAAEQEMNAPSLFDLCKREAAAPYVIEEARHG